MRVVMHPKAHVDDHPEPHAMAKFNDKIKALAGTLEFHRATFEVCAAGCLCLLKSCCLTLSIEEHACICTYAYVGTPITHSIKSLLSLY